MDQKHWHWNKRSTEKTLVAADKANTSLILSEEDELLAEKAELERDVRILNDKLSTALSECNSKDSIAKKQVKIAQEAIAGWEKAEAEAISLRNNLDKVLQQKAAFEERSSQLDAALKDCTQQLLFVREDQEKRVQTAVVKALEEFEKTRFALDEKLAEAGKGLVKLESENAQLKKALSGKDRTIEELRECRAQVEADFNALMLRADSTEKENASLKYEVRVLEKELEIRNEETEFNRRAADAAQKQHKESVQKIAKLESECQSLRLLVRKRLPGPAAMAKMKNEVEMLGRDPVQTRRRRSNPSLISSMDFPADVMTGDAPNKRISFLTEQLNNLEEENRSLRYALNKKSSELQLSRTMYARVASRLSPGDRRVEESLKGQTAMEAGKYPFSLREHSLATLSDVGSDDKASCAESWTSGLVSELENFKNEKQLGTPCHGNMGTPDMYLLDDFVEMEKLAVVSVDYPATSSHHSSEDGNAVIGPSGSPSGRHSSPIPRRKMAAVHSCPSEPLTSQSKNAATHTIPGRLDDLLKMLLEHCRASRRNPQEVVEDMKVALVRNSPDTTIANGEESTNHLAEAYHGSATGNVSSTKNNNQKLQPSVAKSVHKILELLEGLNTMSQDNCAAETFPGNDGKLLACKNPATPARYTVRVFQWKAAELSAILQQPVQICKGLLNGTADLEQFAEVVASNLDWVINHCFPLQDVSNMKDNAVRSHLDWDEPRSESKIDSGPVNHSAEYNGLHSKQEDMSYLPIASLNCRNSSKRSIIKQANQESSVTDLEGTLQSEIVKGESSRIQLQDSKDIIEKLEPESESMKPSDGKPGDQIEKQKMMEEDLDRDLENNDQSYKIQEETCNDLNIQLKSMTSKEVPDDGKPGEKQLQNDWEITAASEKLAECQETLLNLGKQFKALASPRDAALFDNVIYTRADTVVTSTPTSQRNVGQRSSLLDKMMAEDDDQIVASPGSNHDMPNGYGNSAVSADTGSSSKFTNPNSIDGDAGRNAVASTAVVPLKKKGSTSFFKKLFWWHKKGKSKKHPSHKLQ